MDKKIFTGVLQGAQEAVDFMKGAQNGCRVSYVRVPEKVDVKAIRKNLGMTQKIFSETFGFSLDSVRNWEIKRREPEKAARILLRVIEHNPQAVFDATA